MVGAAVEGACRGGSSACRRLYVVIVEDETGWFVGPSVSFEDACPHVFGTCQDLFRKDGELFFFGCGGVVGLGLAAAVQCPCSFKYRSRVYTKY